MIDFLRKIQVIINSSKVQVNGPVGERKPTFNFRVIKKCKSSLERQVREGVRIEMRGNVLNIKGMDNRCKLTRLVVDEECKRKVWEDLLQARKVATGEGEDVTEERIKPKRGIQEGGSRKRAKLDAADGQVWGEAVPQPEQ